MSRLQKSFFERGAEEIARDLLGKYIIHNFMGSTFAGKIVETEAYLGVEDKASHAFGGKKTIRTKALFEHAGTVYIYLVYGMHWMLNFTVGKENGECVLIRSIEPVLELNINNIPAQIDRLKFIKLASGPGRVTNYYKLDMQNYGEDLTQSAKLWVEDRGVVVADDDIMQTVRIGVDYAGDWKDKPLRFYIKKSPAVSRK